MYGVYSRCDNTNATGTVTNCYALYLPTPVTTGAITNKWGVYQQDPNSSNLFAGNVAIGTGAGYLNFGSATTGSTGYGIRDNSGTMEYKNTGGSWTALGSGGSSQWTTSGSNIYYTTGNVSIGTTNGNYALQVQETRTDTSSGWKYMQYNLLTAAPASAAAGTFHASYSEVSSSGTQDINNMIAARGNAYHKGTGTVSNLYAVYGYADNYSSGTVSSAYGVYGKTENNDSGGNLTTAYGSYSTAENSSTTSAITTALGSHSIAQTTTNGANITNAYGGRNYAKNNAAATITTAYGGWNEAWNNSTGTITTAYGTYSKTTNGNASGVMGTAYGVYIIGANSGTLTNWYGLYVPAFSGTAPTTNRYPIYVADTGPNYFAGNVGIGTTAPAAPLTITNNVGSGYLDNYSEYQIILYDGGSAASSYGMGIKGSTMVFNSGVGAYSFDRAGTTSAMVITTGGNVGIGVTSPSQSLEVSGSVSLNNGGSIYGSDSSTANSLSLLSAPAAKDGANIYLYGRTHNAAGRLDLRTATNTNDTTQIMRFIKRNTSDTDTLLGYWRSNGDFVVLGSATNCTIGVGTSNTACSSDARLKDRVKPIENALEKILTLSGVTFHWNQFKDSKPEHMGLIAQDVQRVFPQLISKDDDGYLQLDYSGLVAPLIEAVKTLAQRVSTFAADGNAMRAQLASLKAANDSQAAALASLKAANDNLRREFDAFRASVGGKVQ